MGKRLSVGVKNKGQSRLKRMMQLVCARVRVRHGVLVGKCTYRRGPATRWLAYREKVRAVRSGDETGTER
jgi:hypothetical protein